MRVRYALRSRAFDRVFIQVRVAFEVARQSVRRPPVVSPRAPSSLNNGAPDRQGRVRGSGARAACRQCPRANPLRQINVAPHGRAPHRAHRPRGDRIGRRALPGAGVLRVAAARHSHCVRAESARRVSGADQGAPRAWHDHRDDGGDGRAGIQRLFAARGGAERSSSSCRKRRGPFRPRWHDCAPILPAICRRCRALPRRWKKPRRK